MLSAVHIDRETFVIEWLNLSLRLSPALALSLSRCIALARFHSPETCNQMKNSPFFSLHLALQLPFFSEYSHADFFPAEILMLLKSDRGLCSTDLLVFGLLVHYRRFWYTLTTEKKKQRTQNPFKYYSFVDARQRRRTTSDKYMKKNMRLNRWFSLFKCLEFDVSLFAYNFYVFIAVGHSIEFIVFAFSKKKPTQNCVHTRFTAAQSDSMLPRSSERAEGNKNRHTHTSMVWETTHGIATTVLQHVTRQHK